MTLIDTTKAAEYLGVSEGFMRKMRANGNGPKFVKIGKSIRYDQWDLENFVETLNRFSSSAESEAHHG